MPVIDFHIHLFPPEVAANRGRFVELDPAFGLLYHNPRARLPSVEETLGAMDAAGVDHAVVLGFGWVDPILCSAHNEFLDDVVRRYPDRLSAFGAIQPREPERAAVEVERLSRLGFKGVGELMPHLQGYALADERTMAPVAEAALAAGLPVLTHASEPVGHDYPGKGDVWPGSVLALAERWPELTIIAAHIGGGLPFYELMPEVAAALRNVYYDTAASPLLYRESVYRTVVDLVGPERVLFGTDYPLLQQRAFLHRLRAAGLTEEELGKVLGGNAARLLGWR